MDERRNRWYSLVIGSILKIYFEGGSRTTRSSGPLRKGMSNLLSEVGEMARQKGWTLRLIACGSRNEAFDDFRISVSSGEAANSVLLIDSEVKLAISQPG